MKKKKKNTVCQKKKKKKYETMIKKDLSQLLGRKTQAMK